MTVKTADVIIVGGGNVAMDAARTALRLGAESVTLAYRRTEAEMPARLAEIHHAKEEGVHVLELANPLRFLPGPDGFVSTVELQRMELGEPDASGRRRPVPVQGSEFAIPCDVAVTAIGTVLWQHFVLKFLLVGTILFIYCTLYRAQLLKLWQMGLGILRRFLIKK